MPVAAAIKRLSAFAIAFLLASNRANDFLSRPDEAGLMIRLSKAGAALAGIDSLEDALRPMYASLPKDENGLLPHTAARYALHRLLVKKHGWYVKGLEPDGDARNASAPDQLMKAWVPEHLKHILEVHVGSAGLSLHEVAVLAATLEDVVRNEAVGRMLSVYDMLDIDSGDTIDSTQADDVYDLYALFYLRGGEFDAPNANVARSNLFHFRQNFRSWNALRSWMDSLLRNVTDDQSRLEFSTAKRLAAEFGAQYAFYDARECFELKKVLLSLEKERPGRVRLTDFYAQGRAGNSPFRLSEKVDWLRTLGALDESDPLQPSVIVPNYVTSRPQCLEASSFYAVCCRNECEELMAHLEERIGGPTATPSELLELVQVLPSSTVTNVPRTLSYLLTERLWQVARFHGGLVPLHGRLFAQWMHHVFPRECPFPHEAGTTNPSTPHEWMRETGQASTQATEEEMQCHITGPCVQASSSNLTDLPWTEAEELLIMLPSMNASSPAFHARSRSSSKLSTLLRYVSWFGMLSGLASVSWRGFLKGARVAGVAGFTESAGKPSSRWSDV